MSHFVYFSISVFLAALSSGMTGLGGGILLLAFMSALFPPAVIIPLHGIIQLLSNTSRTLISYKEIDPKIFILFACGSAFGALAGVPGTILLPTHFLTIAMALTILFFTWIPIPQSRMKFKGQFFFLGAIASFLSLFIGATGPLTAPFFLSAGLEKDRFVTTKSACQIPIHLFKIFVYLYSGFVLREWYLEILLAFPLVFAGSFAGKVLLKKMELTLYNKVVKIVISLLALRMLLKLIL